MSRLTGYTRVILAGLSLHFMSYHPKYCTLAYCISCLLDAVDGQAARALGQESKFGAVLDMVTDRCASHVYFYLSCTDQRWKDAPPHVFFAISPLLTQALQFCFNFSSRLISPATTCTCIGNHHKPYFSACIAYVSFHSSLVTGSRNHKLVKSNVSRILSYYYNDSVRITIPLLHFAPKSW